MRERNKLEQSNVVMAGRVKGERERKRETERESSSQRGEKASSSPLSCHATQGSAPEVGDTTLPKSLWSDEEENICKRFREYKTGNMEGTKKTTGKRNTKEYKERKDSNSPGLLYKAAGIATLRVLYLRV